MAGAVEKPSSRGVPGAEVYVPKGPRVTLPQLARAVQGCKGCDLYRNATQAVFGEVAGAGASSRQRFAAQGVAFMLIGEQPGDQEDLAGRPFVGPSGKLLDRALVDVGIDRARAYVTNAVKHFKWVPSPRGKRRQHRQPNRTEVVACRPWLVREITLVQPKVIVCLGATAAGSIFGPAFRLTPARGRASSPAPDLLEVIGSALCMATVHPSSILRAPDHEQREAAYRAMVDDLRAATVLAKAG